VLKTFARDLLYNGVGWYEIAHGALLSSSIRPSLVNVWLRRAIAIS
jgi:hypothetical protein